jgi:hypothetical protein
MAIDKMRPFPFKVTTAIPTYIEERHGRDSTALPFGLISSLRLPQEECDTIDRARAICGFDISRGGFVRVAAYRAAREICRHHDEYLRRMKEHQHVPDTEHPPTVRTDR